MSIINDFLSKRNYCKHTYALLLIYAVQSICSGVSFYITLFLKSNTQFNSIYIASIISATYFGNILGSMVGGYLSDKYFSTSLFKIGLMLQGISLLLLIFTTRIYVYFLLMLCMGFGSFLYITASNYILNAKYDTNDLSRARVISDQAIFSNIGMLISAILMGYSAEGYYPIIFLIISMVIIYISFHYKPAGREFYKKKMDLGCAIDTNHDFSLLFVGLFSITILGLIFSAHKIGYPLYLKKYYGNIKIGYLMALNPLIILIFQNKIIEILSVIEQRSALAIGITFFGVSFCILNISPSIFIIVIACILMTVGEIISTTYAQSLVLGNVSYRRKGTALGIYKALFSGSRVLGAHISGSIIHYMPISTLWIYCCLLLITTALLILMSLNIRDFLTRIISL